MPDRRHPVLVCYDGQMSLRDQNEAAKETMLSYEKVAVFLEDGQRVELYRRRDDAKPSEREPWPETLKGSGLR